MGEVSGCDFLSLGDGQLGFLHGFKIAKQQRTATSFCFFYYFFFARKRLDILWARIYNSPLGPGGIFYHSFLLCQGIFLHKDKKREAPKYLSLWSLLKQAPIYFPMFGANMKRLRARPTCFILKHLRAGCVRAKGVFAKVTVSGIEWCLHRL